MLQHVSSFRAQRNSPSEVGAANGFTFSPDNQQWRKSPVPFGMVESSGINRQLSNCCKAKFFPLALTNCHVITNPQSAASPKSSSDRTKRASSAAQGSLAPSEASHNPGRPRPSLSKISFKCPIRPGNLSHSGGVFSNLGLQCLLPIMTVCLFHCSKNEADTSHPGTAAPQVIRQFC